METWPCRTEGCERRTPTPDRPWDGGKKRLGLAMGTRALSPHLATHSLAKCGQGISPLWAWFLISNSEVLEQSPMGAPSSSVLMI